MKTFYKSSFSVFILLFIQSAAIGQTTLGLGDIAFTGYQSDTPDQFSFVLLKAVEANTTLTFTENGWFDTGGFRSTEGTFMLTFTNALGCGTEVLMSGSTATSPASITTTSLGGSFSLSTDGDQIFAYQGAAPTTVAATNFVAGIQMNGDWDANATSSNTSAQPQALASGSLSIAISPENDNAEYDCSTTSGTPAALLAAIHNPGNWTVSNSAIGLSANCGFSVTPEVSVSVSPASVVEDGAPNLVYTFTRTCTENAITVNFDVDGSLNSFNDYTVTGATTFNFAGGTVDFPIGVSSVDVTIDPVTDTKPEQDEDLTLTVTAGTGYTVGTPSAATGTVTDDDSATISIGDISMDETGAGVDFCFPITITELPEEEVELTVMTSNGTAFAGNNGMVGSSDYIPKTDNIAFSTDFPSLSFCVSVLGDDIVELDETFNVTVSITNTNGQDVTLLDGEAVGTILNDDQCVISFVNAPYSATEGNSGTTSFDSPFNQSNPIDVSVFMDVLMNDSTATEADNDYGSDYVLTITDVPGSSSTIKTFNLDIIADTNVEPNEFFNLTFTENDFFGRDIVFTGGASSISATVTILNDDIDWGDAPDTYATLDASGGPSHGGSNLKLGATNDGEADGQPSANADGDMAEDDGVAFTSALQAGTMATLDVMASEAGLLNAWVDFDGNGDFNGTGEQVFTDQALVAGANSLSFSVPASAVQGNTFARFRLDSGGGLAPTGAASDGEVEDYQVNIIATEYSIDDPMVMEGDAGMADLTFTISRTNNAGTGSVGYSITGGTAISGDDYVALAAGTANFAAGETTQTVTVTVNGDMTVELNETVVMTLDTPVNGTIDDGEGTGIIENDDSAVLTIDNPSVMEGESGTSALTFTASLDHPVDAAVGFDFATGDGSATAPDDYLMASGSSSIGAGMLMGTIEVSINGDCEIEPDEALNMVLNNLMASGREVMFAGGGASLTTMGTILNDDAIPTLTTPADFSQNNDLGMCGASVTVPVPVTTTCGMSVLDFRYRMVEPMPVLAYSAWYDEADNVQVLPVGKHEIQWRITDGSGFAVTTFFITVVDNEAPDAVCQDISIDLDANGMASISPADVDGGTLDNCDFTLSLDKMEFSCADIPSTTVMLTATDGTFSDACPATVTVNDVTPPNVDCMDATVFLDEYGMVSITPATVFAGSSDNCGFIGITDFGPTDFNCGDLGAQTVTLNVNDGNGNVNFCTATVTVKDNLPPMPACLNLSISLGPEGTASILPVQLFDAANSTDNCGAVNLIGISQTDFDCRDEGENTIIVTVDDGNGNVATCESTVTVGGFLILESVTPTDANCTSTGDGTITIVASAPYGQIGYSVDGGATWQLEGFFQYLSQGTYNIVVKVFGVDGVCEKTATATVGTSIGGTQIWYKDIDGDGYTDGLTLTQCTQPTGYVASALPGDCNDYDADEYPGQDWYADLDGDGHGDGSSMEECARPLGHFLISELATTDGDCDDTDASIYPGAPELCDGLDNDCDGNVDEDGGSGLTYMGSVTFTTQAQVDAFSQCYTVIDGNLTIQNSGVNDLSNLFNLVGVTGNVLIKSTGLTSMAGLDNLSTIGGYLNIRQNGSLITLDGLDAVLSVGGYLKVYYNRDLVDCCAIHSLLAGSGIGGSVTITRNETGCDDEEEVEMACGGGSNLMAPPGCTDCGIFATEGLTLQFDMYPNPTNGELNIRLHRAPETEGTVTLFNALGQAVEVHDLAVGQTFLALDVSGKRAGEYIVRVSTERGTKMQRVMVVR